MDPILDIQSVRSGLCTYSLRAPGQPARPCDDYFDSFEHCMHDAAGALLHYFERVEIHLAGLPLGNYAVARVYQDPLTISDEVRACFERAYGDGLPEGLSLPMVLDMELADAGPQRPAHL